MKNLFVTALLLSGAVLYAQRSDPGEMRHLTAEQVATLHTKKLTLALDLNEAQQKDIQKLNEENAKFKKEKMDARKTAREAGSSKELSPDEKYNLQVERLDKAIALKATMKDILTEEQYAKWEKIQFKKGRHKKTGRKDHHRHGVKRGR